MTRKLHKLLWDLIISLRTKTQLHSWRKFIVNFHFNLSKSFYSLRKNSKEMFMKKSLFYNHINCKKPSLYKKKEFSKCLWCKIFRYVKYPFYYKVLQLFSQFSFKCPSLCVFPFFVFSKDVKNYERNFFFKQKINLLWN